MNDGMEREYRRRRAVPTVYVLLAALTVVVALNLLDALTLSGPTYSFLLLLPVPLLCFPLFFLLLDRLGETLVAQRSPGYA
ncbi:hypothetical protein [Streptomyces sp. NPDC127072]|uniref:hypothetical protein n=1 Tax=Streptomyces sp. NPDC127072 TaxID=3347129 RepID=UPI00364CBDDE